MKTLLKFSAALALTCSAAGLQAMPVYTDTFELSDAGGARGIWFNGNTRFATDAGGTFSSSGNSATLAGSASNAGIGGGFSFSVDMVFKCSSEMSDADAGNAGSKYVTVDNVACGLPQQKTGGAVTAADVDGQIWDFWNYAAGNHNLTGFGSLEGMIVTITQKPADLTKPFRVGQGADWDNAPAQVGGSGWFMVTGSSCDVTKACNNSGFSKTDGDFNFSMTALPGDDQIPVPGTIALLGLGLLGLRFNRRNR